MQHQTLRQLPHSQRPRERMITYGADALSHAELLAILLRTGTKNQSAVQLSAQLLQQCGSLRELVDMSLDELTAIKGIGQAKALQLLAGIELGKRVARSSLGDVVTVRSPYDAAMYVMEELRYLKKEHFIGLFLNTKNHIVGKETLSMGTLNASLVHPREVFRAAIRSSSASIICIHNHPSGDPSPSPEDIQITKRLAEAGSLLGIEILDHLIIGDGTFVSLKEQGYL